MRLSCLQLAFQACLEDLEPPVSSRCSYEDVERNIPDDPAFRELPEADRRAVFAEVRQAAASVEEASPAAVAETSAAAQPAERPAQPQEAAPAAASAASATAASGTQTPQQRSELDTLREEQVRAPTRRCRGWPREGERRCSAVVCRGASYGGA